MARTSLEKVRVARWGRLAPGQGPSLDRNDWFGLP